MNPASLVNQWLRRSVGQQRGSNVELILYRALSCFIAVGCESVIKVSVKDSFLSLFSFSQYNKQMLTNTVNLRDLWMYLNLSRCQQFINEKESKYKHLSREKKEGEREGSRAGTDSLSLMSAHFGVCMCVCWHLIVCDGRLYSCHFLGWSHFTEWRHGSTTEPDSADQDRLKLH